MFVLMCGMGAVGKFYYDDTQETIAFLREENATLVIANKTNKEALNNLKLNIDNLNQTLQQVNKDYEKIRSQNNILVNKLRDHDIGLLGNAKPKLVERIVNNASKKTGRCFEILSGAELTEAEKNAKSGKAFNTECPWLWPDSTDS